MIRKTASLFNNGVHLIGFSSQEIEETINFLEEYDIDYVLEQNKYIGMVLCIYNPYHQFYVFLVNVMKVQNFI